MSFKVINPTQNKVPILVSVPHAGITIPEELKAKYKPAMISAIDDTDYYVDRLYEFVSSLGITMVVADISRWVIDLNRSAENAPLYNDGRVITSLCPTTNFNDDHIYIDQGPSEAEVNQRKSVYYYPYYDQIRLELTKLQREFKHVLFFDAHSIRQHVPGIRKEKFPDLILGDVDGTSADTKIISTAIDALSKAKLSLDHNHPFKGGNLTRTFGHPEKNIHGLQLEMAKNVYMNDLETSYHEARANHIQITLTILFENLIDTLNIMNRNE